MTVIELSDIVRHGSPILYRRSYNATAVVKHVAAAGTQSVALRFTIEQTATGKPEVTVDIQGPLDYPVLPAKRVLSEHILQMDVQGMLP